MQQQVFERSRVPVARVSKENQASYASFDNHPVNGHYYLVPKPEDIHIVVAGGAGKHSAFVASFGGTAAISTRIADAA